MQRSAVRAAHDTFGATDPEKKIVSGCNAPCVHDCARGCRKSLTVSNCMYPQRRSRSITNTLPGHSKLIEYQARGTWTGSRSGCRVWQVLDVFSESPATRERCATP